MTKERNSVRVYPPIHIEEESLKNCETFINNEKLNGKDVSNLEIIKTYGALHDKNHNGKGYLVIKYDVIRTI